jgi:hypothetical protein
MAVLLSVAPDTGAGWGEVKATRVIRATRNGFEQTDAKLIVYR